MKNLPALFVAAILGSLITLGAYKGLGLDKKVITFQEEPAVQTVFTNATAPANTAIPQPSKTNRTHSATPVDFRAAAAKTTPAVVHIKSTVSVASSGQQMPGFDIFRDFFGDDFDFGNPYGGGGGQGNERQATGSGVIISRDGYIVTNNHVVADATELEVVLNDNRSYPAEIIGTDPSTDLAVIKISENGLPTLELANSDDVQVGEWVLAVGNPFNLSSTVTAGIVSAKGRNINILSDQAAIESFIQTDAAVNPGNSGGALVNVDGDLVGINTAIATRTGSYSGYSFAVPVNIVEKVVEDLTRFGTVQRAYLGVMIRDLDSKVAKELNLDISQGVYIESLLEEGAAKQAGVQKGDVIVEVDGQSVKSAPELQELIGRKRPGDMATLTINREGRTKNINVPLTNKDGNTNIVKATGSTELMKKLGVELMDLTDSEKNRYGVDGGIKVATIGSGIISKNTDMEEGFIITEVDGRPVNSVQQINAILKNKSGGVLVAGIYPNDPTNYYYGFGL